MTFSIITATFNSRPVLEKTMRSVLTQEGVQLEYLLVDGGSTDGTVELIRAVATSDPRVRWVSEPDRGISDAFNKGLAMASGEVIGILNADDVYLAGALAHVAAAVAKYPEGDVFHGHLLRLDQDGRPLFRLRPASDPAAAIRARMPIYHPATFVTRRAYERVDGFDCTLETAMDYDLVLRLFRAGFTFHEIPELLAAMPYGGVSERRLLLRLGECLQIQLRHGIPWPGALACYIWGLLKGSVKVLLVQLGLARVLTVLPHISGETHYDGKY